jgi:hypothetical protein
MFKNFFKNTISPKSIEMPFDINKGVRDEFKQHQGYVPLVYYNELQISPKDLIYLNLQLKENIPQVKITFNDSIGAIGQRAMPLDNTKLIVFINTRSQLLKPIFIQFKIINVKKESGSIFTLKGAIDLDDLYTINYESFQKSSSIQVLQKVSKQLGLGFNSNIQSTNDTMNWLNYGRKVYQFIKYVANNSYISDNDFTSYYIDYYYHLNYVNIQKELLRDVTNDELLVDVSPPESITGEKAPLKKQGAALSTEQSQRHSNFFIESYTIINNSTSISIQEGYLKTVFYYDNQKKEKLIFELDTLVDDTISKNLVNLKSPGDKEFYKSNFTQEYIGKLDTDNMHKNYNYADFLNNRNLQELEKLTIVATLPTPNFSLYVFQKIPVMFINEVRDIYNEIYNERLTGYYLITNIKYEVSNDRFVQILHLSRRDLTISDTEVS